ncbi:ABC transporter permease subunit [Pseudarthrobacter sp. H3Y2-7]|jgi:ABC-type transport system involved in multi-copper enzyme maturation permease subunit|uniref:ABC transporter permease n=1 Tax=Pseudarthrobacter TaxID=1742993 RepID=UPI0023B1E209|nr:MULTISPECIES: ABC transporter permease subunit [unclassified Pseudarthrobacter]MDE8668781.1 ABC transporter permease subunit [Pseudarthrobacter sp. H3Y2-7]
MSQRTETTQPPPVQGRGGGYFGGIWDVVVLELKQRLRSRGWYIMLGIWFLLTGLVTWLTWAAWNAQQEAQRSYPGGAAAATGPGSMIFEVVLAFVLLFALLVAPALSANAVNGDRAGGTLAILQVTLLRPGQILWGKFFAAWAAALAFLVASAPFLITGVALGGMTPGHVLVALLMLAVEVGVVCAVGVGISALAGRPLFSIVVTYLAVAGLVFGSLIAFGLGTGLSQGTIMANQAQYRSYSPYVPMEEQPAPADPEYTCSGPLREQPAVHTERVAWMLAMNPYVVVADAIPYPVRTSNAYGMSSPVGAIETISQGARYAMAGPDGTYPCANGEAKPRYLAQSSPLWPLGLGLQCVFAGLLLWLGWRELRTPAHRLARGTRIA